MALILQPKVLILDEPTTGLDPTSRLAFWEIIEKNKTNCITLISTHFLEDIEIVGDRVGIMKQGSIIT